MQHGLGRAARPSEEVNVLELGHGPEVRGRRRLHGVHSLRVRRSGPPPAPPRPRQALGPWARDVPAVGAGLAAPGGGGAANRWASLLPPALAHEEEGPERECPESQDVRPPLPCARSRTLVESLPWFHNSPMQEDGKPCATLPSAFCLVSYGAAGSAGPPEPVSQTADPAAVCRIAPEGPLPSASNRMIT